MQDNKLYAAFGIGTTLNVADKLFSNAEPAMQFVLLGLQIIIAALTITLLLSKARDKKK